VNGLNSYRNNYIKIKQENMSNIDIFKTSFSFWKKMRLVWMC